MKRIAFGIDSPNELLGKLRFEGQRLDNEIHPYDVFNFFITASILYEWIQKHYKNCAFVDNLVLAVKEENALLIPTLALDWIIDKNCIPNNARDFRFDILNVVNVCWFTANASKHYHWYKTNPVTAVETEPQIKNLYQYFFTSVEPSLYIEINEQYYNLKQIKDIILQFYSGFIAYLESKESTLTVEAQMSP